jgi:tol-pal system protein YbgF
MRNQCGEPHQQEAEMALSVRATLLTAALVVLLGGCQTGKQWSKSEEWRLQNLEEKALGFKNTQLSHAERLDIVEKRLNQLESQPGDDAPAEQKDQPLLSSQDLPEPGPVTTNAAETPQSDKKWGAYPEVKGKKRARTVKVEAPKKVAKAAPAKASASAMSAKALYDAGLKHVLAGKTKEGRAELQRFIATYPKSALQPNARYWLGESYYHEKRYPESVVAFKDVHRLYPKHEKAAAALLKLGYAYAALGDKGNARFYLNVLLDDYGSTDPAALGRKKLRALR